MSKLKIGVLLILIIALVITSYEWWNSDQGGEYVKQQRYDDNIQSTYTYTDEKGKSGIDFETLLKKNSDVVGWIEISDTPINYPIMLTEDNDYYLSHNLDKEYSSSGSVFIDKRYSSLSNNPFEFTDNRAVVIYGHNMGTWTDVMFTSLKSYLSEKYYKEHKTINIYYPKENNGKPGCEEQKYEIISVTIQKHYSNLYEDIEYMKDNIDEKGKVIDSEREQNLFNQFINLSVYKCGSYKFKKNSNYIFLSTCANDGDEDDRLLIIGRKK